MVFETVELYVTSQQRHSTNNGNYNSNDIRNYYENTIIPAMPQSLRQLLDYVRIPTYYLTSNSGDATKGYSSNRVFMPGGTETGGYSWENGSIFQYYSNMGLIAREKKKPTGTSNIEWWLRTGGYAYNSYASDRFRAQTGVYISATGTFSTLNYSYSSTSTGSPNQAVTNSKGIPIFWAW